MRQLFIFVSLSLCSSCYTLEQAFRFNNTFNNRVPLREMLADPGIDAERKSKLELVVRTLSFAESQGLNVGDAYRFVIPEGQKAVSFSVQAAYPDRLELKTWWFPFAGSVPYLGYFKVEKRDARAKELREEGFDVSEGMIGAFSSLGWFADPLYLSMIQRSEPDVVQLLLHELVHRSFWSRGSAGFNENLAEYVSLHMTEVYLKGQGLDAEWTKLERGLRSQALFRGWLVQMKDELARLYQRNDLTKDEKIARKAEIINTYREQRFPLEIAEEYAGARRRAWNNASILGSTLYLPDMEGFRKAYDCLKPPTAGAFLLALKESERRSKDAEDGLRRVCELRPKIRIE